MRHWSQRSASARTRRPGHTTYASLPIRPDIVNSGTAAHAEGGFIVSDGRLDLVAMCRSTATRSPRRVRRAAERVYRLLLSRNAPDAGYSPPADRRPERWNPETPPAKPLLKLSVRHGNQPAIEDNETGQVAVPLPVSIADPGSDAGRRPHPRLCAGNSSHSCVSGNLATIEWTTQRSSMQVAIRGNRSLTHKPLSPRR